MKGSKTVLVIDDEVDFVRSVASLLEGAGYRVLGAHDSQEGMRLALLERPDLIILDVMITERTEGFFTLQALRHTPELKAVPVIVISSIYTEYPGFGVRPEADWLPADLFLAKPVDPERLIREVERLAGPPTDREGA